MKQHSILITSKFHRSCVGQNRFGSDIPLIGGIQLSWSKALQKWGEQNSWGECRVPRFAENPTYETTKRVALRVFE